jgi:hypothetical protein
MQNSTKSSHPTITEKDVQEAVKKLADAESEYYNALGKKEEAWNEMLDLVKARELDENILKKLTSGDLVSLKQYKAVLDAMDTKDGFIEDYRVLHKDVGESAKKRKKLVEELRRQLNWMDKEIESRGVVYEFRKANV